MQQIKDWFLSLDERDQKITIGGAIAMGFFILYFGLLGPINNSASSLQVEVRSKQKTIDWMKKQVNIIRSNKSGNGATVSNLPLTSIVNNTTKKYSLPVSRRDSQSQNEMQVWFDNVAFDSFLNWASEVKSKYGVTIVSVNVRGRDRDGITSINVKLLK